MRRAFDIYQQHDDLGSTPAAHDESGLRRVRRDRRDCRDLTMEEVARGGWHGSQSDMAHALAASHDEEPPHHRHYYPTLEAAAFVDDATVAVCEDPVQQQVFISDAPGAYDPRGWSAPPAPVQRRRGMFTRLGAVSSERIVIEALMTLAGVVFVAFVCAFVFHVGLSTLVDATRPKTPKLSVSASVHP